MRFILRPVDERVGIRELPLLSVSQNRGVVPRSELTSDDPRADDLSIYKVCRPGDIVVNRMSAYQGALGRSGYFGIVSPDYIVMRPSPEVEGRWLHHLMRSGWFVSEMAARIRGIGSIGTGNVRTPRVSAEEIGDIRVLFPRPEEQRAIADFLDSETARIEALITRKRRLIDLTLERWRGTVRDSTRRGLDPSVAYADSGLPWVGEIPAHWAVVPNRSVFVMRRSQVGPRHENIVLLSLTRRGIIVRDVSDNHGKFPASFDTYQFVSQGEIVFCLFDIPETPRTVGLARTEGMVTGAYTVFSVDNASADYLSYLYQGFDDEKSLSLWYTGLRNVIRPDTFLSMRCPLPPRTEQDMIAGALDRSHERATGVVGRLERQIALLREHRQALITAAVTGELAVPGVAA